MKVYLSSTYHDLVEHRALTARALRQLGHDVIGMEEYVAESSRPAEKCIADVRSASAYVLIIGWRYGYVPSDPDSLGKSITQLEYEAAVDAGIPVIALLSDPSAPWIYRETDAFTGENDRGATVEAFRGEVSGAHIVSLFASAEDAARLAVVGVSLPGRRKMFEQLMMSAESWNVDGRSPFMTGSTDTALDSIAADIREVSARGSRVLLVGIGAGDMWWSTRLYLLSRLLVSQTEVDEMLFLSPSGPIGLATPEATSAAIAAAHPSLATWQLALEGNTADDLERTIQSFAEWAHTHDESTVRRWVRPRALRDWLGANLRVGSIRLGGADDTAVADLQQIIGWPHDHVVIEDRTAPTDSVRVIRKSELATRLASAWVQSAMPRSAIL